MTVRRLDSKQTVKLARTLMRQTDAGLLDWSWNTPAWYFTDKGSYSYVIRSQDADHHHPFIFEVYPSNSWDPDDVLVRVESSDDLMDDPAIAVLEALYQSARRNAESAGDLFDAIMDDLDTPF